MPTNEELHAADQRLEARISEMERQRAHDSRRLATAEDNIAKLDEVMAELRDSIATKDDIAGLRADLREREGLHERLDHYRDRLHSMESEDADQVESRAAARETRFNRRMSWAMVFLFIIEVAQGGVEIWGRLHGQ
jgi:uncharacterized coiled-coil protein SlyX